MTTEDEATLHPEMPWEEEGGCQPLVDLTTEPEIAGMPAQQE
jgi:hypothetical protein